MDAEQRQDDCGACAQLRQELQVLREQVAKLTAALEEERRRGKRQAAPFSKGPPVTEAKSPGRKSGKRHGPHAHRSVPPRIDETYDAPLPQTCPLRESASARNAHRRAVPNRDPMHGGRLAWLHAFVSQRATCYVIDPTRSHVPAEQLLGLDWSGTLVHDGWSVYDRFRRAFHQQCIRHLQRRCQELLETAVRGAVRLPRAILTLIDRAFAWRRAWRGHRLSADDLADRGLDLACELERLASGTFTNEPNRRLAGHLLNHAIQWFWFLIDPAIQATNHWAEQAIRPAVVNRKVWGGNRTWPGARAQSILMSVIRTCRQRAVEPLPFLSTIRCRPQPQFITA